jgi:penicillin-binding protein 1A
MKKVMDLFKNKELINQMLLTIFIISLVVLGLLKTILLSLIITTIIMVIRGDINMKKIKSQIKKGTVKKILLGFFVAGIVVLVTAIALILLVVFTAPEFNPDNLIRQESSTLFDKDGVVIAKLGVEKREIITYEQMPEVLIDAVIATEDSRFFQHNGFDLPRFMKATFGQLSGNSDAGGASTLTMQVSKNNYTSTEASGFEGIKRKFTDIYMSIFKIERNYTKEEIFEFYVNQPNLGAGAYGVEQASLTYFGKHAKDLTLTEAALIAGLFQAPSAYNPFINPERATERRATVLYLMERHGYITSEERKAANAIPVEDLLDKSNMTSDFQGFIDTVVEEVIKRTGKNPYSVPMDIYTTMDRERQLYVDSIFDGTIYTWANDTVDAGMAVVDVKTGAIAAVGAGRNRVGQLQFNTATMIKRQIGSTAKPLYDYGPGLEYNNWSSAQLFADEPYGYSTGQSINNWDNKFFNLMTLRVALGRSRNIPALKAFQQVDNADVLEFVTGLGLSPEIENGKIHEAHSLGGYNGESPLSMATAYASYGNGGYYVEPHSFTKIIFKDIDEVFELKPIKNRVMKDSTAYIMSEVLIEGARRGLGAYSNIPGAVYGAKTGTTNFSNDILKKYGYPSTAINDLWVLGTSPDYAISVWYGYHKLEKGVYTSAYSLEHRKLFQKLGQGVFNKGGSFPKSSDTVKVSIEAESWPIMLPSEGTPSNMIITEIFKKGTEPTEVSPRYAKLSNPTNLRTTLTGNQVSLRWDKIETPAAIDLEGITDYLKSLYTNQKYYQTAFDARVNDINTNIGEVGYNIYQKNTDGTLTLLGFTKEDNYNYTISGATTFVVKATYTINKNRESTGVEKTTGSIANSTSATLNDSALENLSITINNGDLYNPIIKVIHNGIEVVPTSSIMLVNGTDATLNTNIKGVYEVKHTVTYGAFTKVFNVTLTIQ